MVPGTVHDVDVALLEGMTPSLHHRVICIYTQSGHQLITVGHPVLQP